MLQAGWEPGCHRNASLLTLIFWEEEGSVNGLELWKPEKLFLTVSGLFVVIFVHQLDDSHVSSVMAQGFKSAFFSRGWGEPICYELTS